MLSFLFVRVCPQFVICSSCGFSIDVLAQLPVMIQPNNTLYLKYSCAENTGIRFIPLKGGHAASAQGIIPALVSVLGMFSAYAFGGVRQFFIVLVANAGASPTYTLDIAHRFELVSKMC